MTNQLNNLDLYCAKKAQEIAAEVRDEDVIRKTLWVLQEDGVLACFLYLLSKTKKDKTVNEEKLLNKLAEFLKNNPIPQVKITDSSINRENVLTVLNNIVATLDSLIIAKELLKQTLIYARYHTKAYGR